MDMKQGVELVQVLVAGYTKMGITEAEAAKLIEIGQKVLAEPRPVPRKGRLVTAELVVAGMVIRDTDGAYLRVLSNIAQENARRTLHCLSQTAQEVKLEDVNPTLYYGVPVLPGDTVKLTKAGLERVLNGHIGMTFRVDSVSNGQEGPVVHVLDSRYPATNSHRKFAIWSIGNGGYEVVV